MKAALIGVLVIALLGGAFLLSRSSPPITNAPPNKTTIDAFGDSLIEGVGATPGNELPGALARLIGQPIVNAGVAGDTTADGVARLQEVLELDPGIVILLLGGNDTLRRIPESTTEANLRILIEAFQKQGAVVVLLGVRGGLLSDSKAALYESLAEEYGAALVPDILEGILLRPELMHDGIHPNDKGYALIAERIRETMGKHELLR